MRGLALLPADLRSGRLAFLDTGGRARDAVLEAFAFFLLAGALLVAGFAARELRALLWAGDLADFLDPAPFLLTLPFSLGLPPAAALDFRLAAGALGEFFFRSRRTNARTS